MTQKPYFEKAKRFLKEVLTENEIRVYLASIMGEYSVQKLAKRAGLDRSNTYRIIQTPADKGLISQELKRRGRVIIPEHPKKLPELIEKYRHKLRRKIIALQELVPELAAQFQYEQTVPRVRLYEGKEGWLTVSKNTLESGAKEVLFITSVEDIYRFADQKEYDEGYYIPARIQKGIIFRQLLLRSPQAIEQQKRDAQELRKTRFLSEKTEFRGAKFIYGNDVAYMTGDEPLVGVIITSPLIAEMEQKLFEELWQHTESKETHTRSMTGGRSLVSPGSARTKKDTF